VRETPPGLSPFWRRVVVATLVVQVLVVLSVTVVTALEFHVWSPIDEEAHFSYIQQVAEHGSLPVLGRTPTSPQGLAIAHGTYPRPVHLSPAHLGLIATSYEAFQPPLYYVLAVPAFDVPSNYLHKVYAVRLFGVGLLLVAIVLAARLARVVLGDRWMLGWSMVLAFLTLPGVVLRMATISPTPLAVVLGILFVTELWLAWTRHSAGRLLGAGAVAGLCVLTELELLAFLPVLALVVVAEVVHRTRRHRADPAEGRRPGQVAVGWVVAALAVPVVLVAPWLAFNEATYHLLTAGTIAIREQTYLVNPQHLHFSPIHLPDDTAVLIDPTLPAEWINAWGANPSMAYLGALLAVMMGPAALFVILGKGRKLWSVRWAILGLPVLVMLVELLAVRYVEQWVVQPRYAYAALPGFLVLAAAATRDTFRASYLPVLGNAVAAGVLVTLWSYLFFFYQGNYHFWGA
jgi:hypothetical protein